MARTPAKRDFETDFDRLSRLISLAKGGRSQKAFAIECGVTPQHICRCIRKKISYTPSIQFLEKIANHAANNVQLADLLSAAGYDIYNMPESELSSRYVYSYDDELGEITSINVAFPPFDLVYGMMVVELSKLLKDSFRWTPTYKPNTPKSFSIIFNGSACPIKKWDFIMISSTTFEEIDAPGLELLELLKYAPPKTKVSFVTISKNIFTTISEYHLNATAPSSAILIDPIPKSVIVEQYINGSLDFIEKLNHLTFPDRLSSISFKQP